MRPRDISSCAPLNGSPPETRGGERNKVRESRVVFGLARQREIVNAKPASEAEHFIELGPVAFDIGETVAQR